MGDKPTAEGGPFPSQPCFILFLFLFDSGQVRPMAPPPDSNFRLLVIFSDAAGDLFTLLSHTMALLLLHPGILLHRATEKEILGKAITRRDAKFVAEPVIGAGIKPQ